MTSHQSESSETVAPRTLEPERAAPWLTILKTKPCPICGEAHGNSAWAVVKSSTLRPRTCKSCGEKFHQTGLLIWGIVFVLFQSSMLESVVAELAFKVLPDVTPMPIKIFAFFVTVYVQVFVAEICINRTQPLAPEPQYG